MSTIDWSIREIRNDIENDLAIGVMGRGTGAGMNSRASGNWEGGETWSNGFKALCDIGLTVLECENGGIGGILRSGGVLDTIGQALEGVIDDLGNTIPNYQLDAKSDGTSHPYLNDGEFGHGYGSGHGDHDIDLDGCKTKLDWLGTLADDREESWLLDAQARFEEIVTWSDREAGEAGKVGSNRGYGYGYGGWESNELGTKVGLEVELEIGITPGTDITMGGSW